MHPHRPLTVQHLVLVDDVESKSVVIPQFQRASDESLSTHLHLIFHRIPFLLTMQPEWQI